MRKTILFSLALFTWILSNAQSFNFNYYSVDKGLSQSEVKCVKEDSRGYIWVGTAGGGACRFNGEEFRRYEEREGLAGQIVTCIEEDSKGNMWFGTTWGGVSKFDGKVMTNFNTENGLQTNSITSLLKLEDGKMLVGSSIGLSLIDGKSIQHFKNRNVDGVPVNMMIAAPGNAVLIITDRAIVEYRNNQFESIYDLKILGTAIPSCIAKEKNGKYWMGTLGHGLFSFSYKEGKISGMDSLSLNVRLKDLEITSVFFDATNNLWLTTAGFGAACVKKNAEIQFYNKMSGLLFNSILCGTSDEFGNIWMGTSGGGLAKFSSGAFLNYQNYEGFKNNNVFAVLCDKENAVWIGVYGAGIYRLKNGELTRFTDKEGLKSNFVRALFQDSKGRIWIGTNKGPNQVSGNKIVPVNIPAVSEMNIRSFCEDNDGNIFIGTNGNGLFVWDGQGIKEFNEKNSALSHMYIHTMLKDKKGKIWMGTGNGVHEFQNGKLSNFKLSSGFCNSYIGSIAEDRYGHIWFGTDRCLTRFNGNEFRSYTENDGLASGTIYLLASDNDGNIWVGSNKGLDKVVPDESGGIKRVINYGLTEGFKGVECNSRAVSKDISGNLWFGTVNGVFEYRPGNDNIRIAPPKIRITSIDFHDRDMDDHMYAITGSGFIFPDKMKLKHQENHLTFEFDGIQHLSPEKIKYQYKLLGFDKNWIDAGRNKRVSYTNLGPGKYEFIVRAGVNGVYSVNPAKFRFSISAPFWKRWWFLLLMGVLVIMAFYSLEKIRRRRNEIAKIRLENQVAKRTSEILKQKREIETLLKEIHHRVKNNLQIINSLLNIQSSYIKDEESLKIFEECKNRIITMSIIHEKLYESKDLSHLNMKAYLEKLTGFLERAFNLDKKISFDIELNDVGEIGLDTIIPIGLLVNEIVSNSLKYAFEGREEGRVEIRISRLFDNKYELVIGDDGKGFDFEQQKQLNSSFGVELIAILSEQLNGEIRLLNRPGTWYSLAFEKIDKSANKQP